MKPIQNISKDPIAREKVEEAYQDISGIENPEFTEATTRANINSKESLPTLFGKIKKFFTDLKAVAFSGSYNDLSDKPTIPTVNNATLTIQKNGTTVKTFTANASSNVTANIEVPTNNNQLTNGAGYITSSGSCESANTATTASKLGSSTLGGSNQPIYLNAGAATKCNSFVPTSGGTFNAAGGTEGTESWTTVTVGNSTGAATAKNSAGRVRLYRGNGVSATTAYYTEIRPGANTANRTITFPNAGGTIALTTSDISGNAATATTATNTSLPRVSANCNTLPSASTSRIREYTESSTNLPTSHYYHILESGSTDTNWGTQLALGMTVDAIYYRRYAGGSWQSWGQLAYKDDIPTVNNAKLTIQKNGTTVKTFTANASSNVTCNITVPTKLSELSNDLIQRSVTSMSFSNGFCNISYNSNVLILSASFVSTDSGTTKGIDISWTRKNGGTDYKQYIFSAMNQNSLLTGSYYVDVVYIYIPSS